MKTLTALAAFLLVLLPTQLPPWLDTAPPLGSEPARRRVRGTVVREDDRPQRRRSPRRSLAPPAPSSAWSRPRGRPTTSRALTVGRPFGVALGPRRACCAPSRYGIDELRTLQRVPPRRRACVAESAAREYETRTVVVGGRDRVEPLRGGRGRGRGRPARARPRRHLRLGRRLQHRDPAGRLASASRSRSSTSTADFARYGADPGRRVRARARACCGRCASRARAAPATTSPTARPLRKAFLRSPLRFTRISSRFTPVAAAPDPRRAQAAPRRRLRGARRHAGAGRGRRGS